MWREQTVVLRYIIHPCVFLMRNKKKCCGAKLQTIGDYRKLQRLLLYIGVLVVSKAN